MSWKEPHERQSDEQIAAIERASHLIARTLAAGFQLLAAAAAPHPADNSPAIIAATRKLHDLTSQLNQSHPPA